MNINDYVGKLETDLDTLQKALKEAIAWHESERGNEPGESSLIDGWRSTLLVTEVSALRTRIYNPVKSAIEDLRYELMSMKHDEGESLVRIDIVVADLTKILANL